MRTTMRPAALIVTDHHWPTHAALARLLAEAGFDVHALGVRRSMGSSRYVTTFFDAPASSAGVAEALRRHLESRTKPYERVIVCSEDVLSIAAQTHSPEQLATWFPAPLERLPEILSKHAFLETVAQLGTSVPRTLVCADAEQAHEAAERLGYPVVAKPSRGHGGLHVRFVSEPNAWGTIDSGEWPIGVQEWIGGATGTSEVLFRHGIPVRWFSSIMLDCFPHQLAPSTSRQIVQVPAVEAMLHAAGTATAFDGIAGVDWILDRASGRAVILEMNPRPQTCLDLTPETRKAFALTLAQIATNQPIAPLGAIVLRTTAPIAQFPQALYYALFAENVPLARRVSTAARSLAKMDRTDPRVARTHFADLGLWLYHATPLEPLVRRAAQVSALRPLKACLRSVRGAKPAAR